MSQVRAGNIKAYAVTAKSRIAVAPDIPTTDEAGLPGFYFSFWHALWAPKGTPKEIVAKLNDAAVEDAGRSRRRARSSSTWRRRSSRADQQTPQALLAFHKAEIEKWWPIIKAAGIKVE